MNIIEIIDIINETYETFFIDYKNCFMYDSALLTFTNGYCYDFFCLLKMFYPNAKLMMKNDKMHCAALINNNLYDATGLREDIYNFHLASGSDIEYIYKYYGFFSSDFKSCLNEEILKKVSNDNKNSVKTLNKIYKYSII